VRAGRFTRVSRVTYVVAVATLCVVMTGCGGSSTSGTAAGGDGSGAADGKTTVGMALVGPRNDGGFAQSHYEGLLEAEKTLNVKGTAVDNIPPGQPRLEALKNLALTNDLVIGVGAEFAPAGVAIAAQFPDVEFVIINGQLSQHAPNLHVYFAREGVPAYIAGAVATKLSQTGTVGFVGGELIPPTTQSDDAFKAAVQATDPSVQTLSINTGDFNNVAEAKQATATEIAQGADVIFLMLDNAIEGAQQAIRESGKDVKVFSIIVPRCETAKNIVGCATLQSSKLVQDVVKDFQGKTLPPDVKAYGVENPDVQAFELCPDWRTPELVTLVEDLTEQINKGKITLPEGV
jgi:basic membrane protein A